MGLLSLMKLSPIPPLQAIHRHDLPGVRQAVRNRLDPLRDKKFLIVSLNPDLLDEFGHYLHMDRELVTTAESLGGASLTFASVSPAFLTLNMIVGFVQY